jgi:hypothetical protein
MKEAQSSKTVGFYQKLKRNVQDLEIELKKLDPGIPSAILLTCVESAKLLEDWTLTEDKGKTDKEDHNNNTTGKAKTRVPD